MGRSKPSIAPHVRHVNLVPSKLPPASLWQGILFRTNPDRLRLWKLQQLEQTIQEDRWKVQEAIAHFVNLEEYSIDWIGAKGSQPLQEFLSPVLVPSNLFALQEFFIHTFTHDCPNMQIQTSHTLDALGVFVNNLRNLRVFSLTSDSNIPTLDLSRFYQHLGTFPGLMQISLTIPLDGTHLQSPEVFVAFLLKHSKTLRGLSLVAGRYS
ncbi:hypothetical protein AX16_000773, partial [Volvariella volvacea WC 439]